MAAELSTTKLGTSKQEVLMVGSPRLWGGNALYHVLPSKEDFADRTSKVSSVFRKR